LSLHLMRLPEYLIDYVILHELCHTIEKNHGKYFWALLEKVSPGARKLAKELKKYNARIY
ncbi:MAG TPA: M48 family peptidase, partial [Crocinitomix sp.]|nr:M48 family peptidase [Crocinitomix sp.]